MFVRACLAIVVCLSIHNCIFGQVNRRAPTQNRNQPRAATGKERCVDVIQLRNGKVVRGLVIGKETSTQDVQTGAGQGGAKSGKSSSGGPRDAWLVAVERKGLERLDAGMYERAMKAEREVALAAWMELDKRLENELTNAGDLPLVLKSLYERERARAQQSITSAEAMPDQGLPYRFIWMSLNEQEVSQVQRASPELQKVAVWSWSEQLADVETRDRAELVKELQSRGVDPALDPPDLSSLLAPRKQSDNEWAARLAIVRYTHQSQVDFQGSGDIYVRAGAQAAAIDMAPLIAQMMEGNLKTLLSELDPASRSLGTPSNKEDWFRVAIPKAEALKVKEFRITRVDTDPTAQQANVESALVALMPGGTWQSVWSTKSSMASSSVTADMEKQISEDPQVKNALSLLSALGAAAESEVRKAIRFGAATMNAQRTVDSYFFRFRDRLTERLDGPPLLIR